MSVNLDDFPGSGTWNEAKESSLRVLRLSMTLGGANRKPWNSSALAQYAASWTMPRAAVHTHSPALTWKPPESWKGRRAFRRVLTDSTGIILADSFMKLSRRGKHLPPDLSKASHPVVSISLLNGSTYSGWRQRSWRAKQTVCKGYHKIRTLPGKSLQHVLRDDQELAVDVM